MRWRWPWVSRSELDDLNRRIDSFRRAETDLCRRLRLALDDKAGLAQKLRSVEYSLAATTADRDTLGIKLAHYRLLLTPQQQQQAELDFIKGKGFADAIKQSRAPLHIPGGG